MLLYDHEHIIESRAGVQQGDPLGPLYCCCGIMAMVNDIQAMNPIYNKWYMDDEGIVGDVELLKQVWDLLLHLNPAKCEWSEIQMLGVHLETTASYQALWRKN